MAKLSLDFIRQYTADIAEQGKGKIAKFQDNLNANPAHAFQWGEDAVYGAAQINVAAYITESLKRADESGKAIPQAVADAIIEYATNEALRQSSYTSQSTSVMSNLVARYTIAVWAALAHKAHEKEKYSS